MLKILIWHVSDDTSFKDKAINILEQQHNGIEIVGEAVNENIAKVDGGGEYDVFLCVGAKKFGMSKFTADAHKLNLPEEKLLGDWIVCIPGFTLEKYHCLQNSRLSIIAAHCFGGCVSNMLGLTQLSPFGTNGWDQAGFIRFLRDPHRYLEEKPICTGEIFNNITKKYYPIGKLGDIPISLMHYKTTEQFIKMWEKRKTRINWDNVLLEMRTEDPRLLEEFDALPYDKKVCFVPFKSDLPSAWYINVAVDKHSKNLEEAVRRFFFGKNFFYDLFDMLLYGKKTPLIDM